MTSKLYPEITRDAVAKYFREFKGPLDFSDLPTPAPRPTGSNADEWALFLSENLHAVSDGSIDGIPYVAVQIAELLDQMKAVSEGAVPATPVVPKPDDVTS